MSAIKLNPNEIKVLRALHASYADSYGGFCFANFAGLSRRTRLKRKGYAEFSRGLWTEDGEVAGSGYACTKLGASIIEAKTR